MIIDGKAIAEDILRSLEGRRVGKTVPKLGIVMAGSDSITDSFVRIKTRAAERLGVGILREVLAPNATTADALGALRRLSRVASGIIVQLPLPVLRQGFPGVDTEQVLAAIPPERDIDAINPIVAEQDRRVHSPVSEAIAEILLRGAVEVRGKYAVVIGEGRLVGKPAAYLLLQRGARVSVVTHTRGSLNELKDADIIVSGAGEPGIIKPASIKPGVVLIDAGTSEQGGKLMGDADPACAAVASVFTPVPGGVGPIAVAMIFKNLFALAEKESAPLR